MWCFKEARCSVQSQVPWTEKCFTHLANQSLCVQEQPLVIHVLPTHIYTFLWSLSKIMSAAGEHFNYKTCNF